MKQLERLVTDVPGLDTLLKGGLVRGASYMIQGRPGSGKTILANQIGFNHVRRGGRMLFASLLAEPHDRLFQFLSTLKFFDKAAVGESVQFVSAFDTLENDGLDAVVMLLRREISRQKSTLLVLDGLLNARSRADSALDTKKFISALQGHAAFAGCTVLFLTSSQLEEGSPEHTMVDGVIELGEQKADIVPIRHIQLRKTRGSSAISGAHEFEIDENGISVYPRFESLFPVSPPNEDVNAHLITSAIPTLDASIGGGLKSSSVTLLMGPSGAGKTSLGLQFLAAGTVDEPALHFGLHETPARVRLKSQALGLGLSALEAEGALRILWTPAGPGLVDRIVYELLDTVDKFCIRRVLIDSINGLGRTSADNSRVNSLVVALVEALRSRGVTVFMTYELDTLMGPRDDHPAPGFSSAIDNLLLIDIRREGNQLRRYLNILKVRDNAFDPARLQVVMSNAGVQLKKD